MNVAPHTKVTTNNPAAAFRRSEGGVCAAVKAIDCATLLALSSSSESLAMLCGSGYMA